jgi:hypothetical protein
MKKFNPIFAKVSNDEVTSSLSFHSMPHLQSELNRQHNITKLEKERKRKVDRINIT